MKQKSLSIRVKVKKKCKFFFFSYQLFPFLSFLQCLKPVLARAFFSITLYVAVIHDYNQLSQAIVIDTVRAQIDFYIFIVLIPATDPLYYNEYVNCIFWVASVRTCEFSVVYIV